MSTFAKTHAYPGGGDFELGFSDDGKAFTLTFAGFEAVSDTGKPPVATRVFGIVLPLADTGGAETIAFRVSAFATTRVGSSATLVLSVNGQTSVADVKAGSDGEVMHELAFDAAGARECRLGLVLIAGRTATDAEAAAFVGVSSIDAEIGPGRKT